MPYVKLTTDERSTGGGDPEIVEVRSDRETGGGELQSLDRSRMKERLREVEDTGKGLYSAADWQWLNGCDIKRREKNILRVL